MLDHNPVRILRIIARLNIGGPAIQAISLSEHFSRGDYRTLLLCGQVSPHEGDMSYLAGDKGVRPHILSALGREISLWNDLKALMALWAVIRRFRPHVIHTHTAKAGTLGRLAGIGFNLFRGPGHRIKLVHTFHGHIFHSYFGRLKTLVFVQIEKFLARFSDRIIVISPLQEEDICVRFKIAGPEKVRIIPLGFDLSGFDPPRGGERPGEEERSPEDSNESLRVGIVGRLTPVKNHHMFLDAVKRLKDRGQGRHFRFVVVGDGELRDDLEKYAKELGVEQSVLFAGWQRQMPSVYRTLDIVVLTSLNEGTPVTLIEAMAAERPVVATDVGGVGDLLGVVDKQADGRYKLGRNGILIPPGESDALADALLFLLKNRGPAREMALRAKRFVAQNYSRERLLKDIKCLYDELLKD
jgi:glycosyltransferase involved in cell wall biosynthesis